MHVKRDQAGLWTKLAKPVVIIGAGIAGLTAALDFERRRIPTIVLEAGKTAGGLASSFKDDSGFTYDFGAHFVSNRLAEALGAAEICRTVPHYGEAVHVEGRDYGYPLGLMASPRFVASALAARFNRHEPAHAADWFRNGYGEALARDVAIPLAEAWSGVPATELAASVGEKFGSGVFKTVYLKAAARVTGRAVCNGYAREMPENAGVYHVYPEGGISKLLEPMLRQVEHRILFESPVEKVIVENGRVAAVRSRGTEIPVAAVVSTAPVNILPRLVEGTDALAGLEQFRYRPMIFVNLRFTGRALLPDTMLVGARPQQGLLPRYRGAAGDGLAGARGHDAADLRHWLPGRRPALDDAGRGARGDLPRRSLRDRSIAERALSRRRRHPQDAGRLSGASGRL